MPGDHWGEIAVDNGAGAGRPLRVLVVGTSDRAVDEGARAVAERGHVPLRCHLPGAPDFPCNALLPGGTCPLDEGVDVVATIRVRPMPRPSPRELGVTCGLCRGVTLVVAGNRALNPFEPWTTTVAQSHDIALRCEEVAAGAARAPVGEMARGPEEPRGEAADDRAASAAEGGDHPGGAAEGGEEPEGAADPGARARPTRASGRRARSGAPLAEVIELPRRPHPTSAAPAALPSPERRWRSMALHPSASGGPGSRWHRPPPAPGGGREGDEPAEA